MKNASVVARIWGGLHGLTVRAEGGSGVKGRGQWAPHQLEAWGSAVSLRRSRQKFWLLFAAIVKNRNVYALYC